MIENELTEIANAKGWQRVDNNKIFLASQELNSNSKNMSFKFEIESESEEFIRFNLL